MSAPLVAPIGGPTEAPPDNGDHESTMYEALVTGDVTEVEDDSDLGGRPPGFPWGGHSNGVSKRP